MSELFWLNCILIGSVTSLWAPLLVGRLVGFLVLSSFPNNVKVSYPHFSRKTRDVNTFLRDSSMDPTVALYLIIFSY